MEEGTLAKWNVKEGDTVSSGDVIAEIETDKATMEVEAVDEGTVGKIIIAEGSENVKVNEPIAVLLDDGESMDDVDLSALNGSGAESSPASSPSPADAVAPASKEAEAKPDAPQPVERAPKAGGKANGRVLASPLAKRLAQEEGLDLSAIKGSGPRGRVVKRDIKQALKDGVGKAGSAASAPAAIPVASVDARLYPAESYEAVKLDGMRKVIAKRLTQSFNQEVPHFPLNVDVELDTLLAARARINATSPKEGDGAFKLSVNDFILKASAMALKAVPAANATYTDEAILLHKHADIGVAGSDRWRTHYADCLESRGKGPQTDFRRSERHGGSRQKQKIEAGRISRWNILRVEPWDVRYQELRLYCEPTSRRDHVRGRG